jgi:hypothetical protein
MTRDIPFEAAYLRDAILVGLVHERDVVPWATDLLDSAPAFADALVRVLSAPVELSPIREALRAFGNVDDPVRVTEALLIRAALEPPGPNDGDRLLRVLSDVRRLAGCPTTHADAIKDFEARAMLATVGGGVAPTAGEITRWLDGVRPPARFFIPLAADHIPYPDRSR